MLPHIGMLAPARATFLSDLKMSACITKAARRPTSWKSLRSNESTGRIAALTSVGIRRAATCEAAAMLGSAFLELQKATAPRPSFSASSTAVASADRDHPQISATDCAQLPDGVGPLREQGWLVRWVVSRASALRGSTVDACRASALRALHAIGFRRRCRDRLAGACAEAPLLVVAKHELHACSGYCSASGRAMSFSIQRP